MRKMAEAVLLLLLLLLLLLSLLLLLVLLPIATINIVLVFLVCPLFLPAFFPKAWQGLQWRRFGWQDVLMWMWAAAKSVRLAIRRLLGVWCRDDSSSD